MTAGRLEHVNVTVADAHATADRLCRLFGWEIRWEGPAISGGYTIHVGEEESYLAIYMVDGSTDSDAPRHLNRGGMNHIGVVVDDLDEVTRRVEREGLEITATDDYEPGRRFYFSDDDRVEYEVVSYA